MLILPCATFVPTGVVGAAVSGAIAGPAALSKGDTSVYTICLGINASFDPPLQCPELQWLS